MDGQVGNGTPEGVQRTAAVLTDGSHATVDDDGRRILAHAVDLGVIADRDVQRVVLRPISTRLEKERITRGAHLVVDLLGVDGVDRGLDVGLRHARG